MHFTTIHRALCIELWTLHTAHCILNSEHSHCILHTAHCTMQSAIFTLITAHWTLHTVHCTLYTVHCTLYTAIWNLHTNHCTLNTAHCTLYTAHCTLYTAHCTMHTTHCTLHTAQWRCYTSPQGPYCEIRQCRKWQIPVWLTGRWKHWDILGKTINVHTVCMGMCPQPTFSIDFYNPLWFWLWLYDCVKM